MLRRRRRADGEHRQAEGDREPGMTDTGRFEDVSAATETVGEDMADSGARGPWDDSDDYPAGERFDCGSLRIPIRDGFDVQLNIAADQGAWAAVVSGDSGMQLQAFAAPRSDGLWDEMRQEIAAGIAESDGTWQEHEGPFGVELHAVVPVIQQAQPGESLDSKSQPDGVGEAPGHGVPGQGSPEQAGAAQTAQRLPVRFIGVDGPRWLVQAVLSGPAATDQALAEPFEEIFADIVVVRGDYPAPPRQPLEIRLPEETRQALEAQFEQENPGWELPNPFVRGPEITEIH